MRRYPRSREAAKRALRAPADAMVVSSSKLAGVVQAVVSATVMEDPAVAAKFFPHRAGASWYLLGPLAGEAPSELPVPPPELWMCIEQSREFYLESGRRDTSTLLDVLAAAGAPLTSGQRVLDLGCGAGRMIRWLEAEAADNEIWGVDIQAQHVLWCQEHLTPPFHFATTTTFPHLPFPDGHFDVVYAGSVFTHVADLADAWLLELRRVLAPGGHLYATVHDEHSIDLIMEFQPGHRLYFLKETLIDFERDSGFRSSGFRMFSVNRTPQGAQVFYDIDYLRVAWGRQFEVRSVTQEALLFQTALLLRKPPGSTS